jgi:hypothetical protein
LAWIFRSGQVSGNKLGISIQRKKARFKLGIRRSQLLFRFSFTGLFPAVYSSMNSCRASNKVGSIAEFYNLEAGTGNGGRAPWENGSRPLSNMVAEATQVTPRHRHQSSSSNSSNPRSNIVKITSVKRLQIKHFPDCEVRPDGWCKRLRMKLWHVDECWKGRLEGCECVQYDHSWHEHCPCHSCETTRVNLEWFANQPTQFHVWNDLDIRLTDAEVETYCNQGKAREKMDELDGGPSSAEKVEEEEETAEMPISADKMSESQRRRLRKSKARKAKRAPDQQQ